MKTINMYPMRMQMCCCCCMHTGRNIKERAIHIINKYKKRLANDPNIRYAILSLHEGLHLNSFKIVNGEVVDKEVHYDL